ncbi:hypothetical protein BJX70DRAFT_369688 [Aspergillus crustosus]
MPPRRKCHPITSWFPAARLFRIILPFEVHAVSIPPRPLQDPKIQCCGIIFVLGWQCLVADEAVRPGICDFHN